MNHGHFDVIIIGGGINGTGVARDCALRGLKPLLLERYDLSVGATWASSGMIHGGLRYLLYDVKTTKNSCIDSGYIQQIAPFCLFRLPFLYPVIPGETLNVELLEAFFETYDRYAPLKNGKKHCRLTKAEVLELEPGITDRVQGAITFDEWGIDATRLCILNAKDAEHHGGVTKLYHEVVGLERDGKKITGVVAKNVRTQMRESFFAPVVLNLAGAWIPRIAEMAGVEVKLRPGKGIHLVLDRQLSSIGLIMAAVDKRSLFVLPYGNYSLIGTTDTDFYGDPGKLDILRDEVDYLLESAINIFPSCRHARVMRSFAGIRPTAYEWGTPADQLSRAHHILDHEIHDGVPGFITMLGGKLATYRMMSEELTDLVMKKLGAPGNCQTHSRRLPGGEKALNAKEFSQKHGLTHLTAQRLIQRHGTVSEKIMECEGAKNISCLCEPVTEAEARYVIKHEWCETLGDLARRTKFGLGPCAGAHCLHRGMSLLMSEKNRPSKEIFADAKSFIQEQWNWRHPLLEGPQIVQEEFNAALWNNSGNIGRACK